MFQKEVYLCVIVTYVKQSCQAGLDCAVFYVPANTV